jgi:hypothetical protein
MTRQAALAFLEKLKVQNFSLTVIEELTNMLPPETVQDLSEKQEKEFRDKVKSEMEKVKKSLTERVQSKQTQPKPTQTSQGEKTTAKPKDQNDFNTAKQILRSNATPKSDTSQPTKPPSQTNTQGSPSQGSSSKSNSPPTGGTSQTPPSDGKQQTPTPSPLDVAKGKVSQALETLKPRLRVVLGEKNPVSQAASLAQEALKQDYIAIDGLLKSGTTEGEILKAAGLVKGLDAKMKNYDAAVQQFSDTQKQTLTQAYGLVSKDAARVKSAPMIQPAEADRLEVNQDSTNIESALAGTDPVAMQNAIPLANGLAAKIKTYDDAVQQFVEMQKQALTNTYQKMQKFVDQAKSAKPVEETKVTRLAVVRDAKAIDDALLGTDPEALRKALLLVKGLPDKLRNYIDALKQFVETQKQLLTKAYGLVSKDAARVKSAPHIEPAEEDRVAVNQDASTIESALVGTDPVAIQNAIPLANGLAAKIKTYDAAVLKFAQTQKQELIKEYQKLTKYVESVRVAPVVKEIDEIRLAVVQDAKSIDEVLKGTDLTAMQNGMLLVTGLPTKLRAYNNARKKFIELQKQALLQAYGLVSKDAERIRSAAPVKETEKTRLAALQDITTIENALGGTDVTAMRNAIPVASGLSVKIKAYDEATKKFNELKRPVSPPKDPIKTPTTPSTGSTAKPGKLVESTEQRNTRIVQKCSDFQSLEKTEKDKRLLQSIAEINKTSEKDLAQAGVEKYIDFMLAFSHKPPTEPHEIKAMHKLYAVMKLDPAFLDDDRERRNNILTSISNDPSTKTARQNWTTGGSLNDDKGKQEQLKKIQKLQCKELGFEPGEMQFGVDLKNSSGQCSGNLVKFSKRSDHNTDFDDTLNTLIHETTHAYQNELAKKFNNDLSLNDPEFAKDPRYAQTLLFKMNGPKGMYVQPPPLKDPAKKLSDEDWQKTTDYKLHRRAYDNEPMEAHAWKAGNEAGRVFDSEATKLKLVPVLTSLKQTGLIDQARLSDLEKALKGSISDVAGAIEDGEALAKEAYEKLYEFGSGVMPLMLKAQQALYDKQDIEKGNEAGITYNNLFELRKTARELSNAERYIDSLPHHVKAYEAAKEAKATFNL